MTRNLKEQILISFLKKEWSKEKFFEYARTSYKNKIFGKLFNSRK